MKTKQILTPLLCLACLMTASHANADIRIGFNRTGTDAGNVKLTLTDENGKAIEGASATMTSSHALMDTKGNVTSQIVCPNVNAMEGPTILLKFNIKGLPAPQKFTMMDLDIHALNKAGGYQRNINDKPRKFNVTSEVGKAGGAVATFGALNDIDIAANVGDASGTHKIWTIENENAFTAENDCQIVLTVTKGSANNGCFFGLSEITLKEANAQKPETVCPFKTSSAVGNAEICYAVSNAAGKHLSMDKEGKLTWAAPGNNEEQIWYFVNAEGTSNEYLMVNFYGNRIYNLANETETHWTVASAAEGAGFYFIPAATKEDLNTKLTVDGEAVLTFNTVHNAFARAAQIYEIPCGTLGACYITRLSVEGDVVKPMHYPLNKVENGVLVTPEGLAPANEYYIYTEDKATVTPGEFNVNLQLNAAPAEGMEGYLYFDWDRDGIFETCQEFVPAKETVVRVDAPVNIKEGKSRARIRLTDNGMKGGDNEVSGQIFDFVLNQLNAQPESFSLKVKANDASRGVVTANVEYGWNEPCEVTATPLGNATFICWREGLQIVSLDKNYQFTLDHKTQLVGYFSVNTDNTATDIEEHFAEKNHLIQIAAENKCLKVVSQTKVVKMMVFTPNGQLVAQGMGDTLQLTGASAGAYIVKVFTETADETAKILIK